MGTGGVAVTFCKAASAWPWLLRSPTNTPSADVHVAASAFETVRAQTGLDPIKSLCLSIALPSWLCCLFLLCVIHIHSIKILPYFEASQNAFREDC